MNDKEQNTPTTPSSQSDGQSHPENKSMESAVDEATHQVKHDAHGEAKHAEQHEDKHEEQHEKKSEWTHASAHTEPSLIPERTVLESLAREMLNEQKANRRWRNFFRFSVLLVTVVAIWAAFDISGAPKEVLTRHTALVELNGEIDGDSSSASASVLLPALNSAFSDEASAGIILRVNSPGGSPVQAGIVNDEITRLRALYPKKPLYVVVEDMCASGCYYIAAAADGIYVNQASIVGSIGVLMSSFGFTGLMEKIGVERRLMTAGENKGFLDPFSAQTPKQKEFTQGLLHEIHEQFIAVVRKGRGKRLKETPDMFSGLFWTGSKAISLGLADGLGTVDSVARDVIKAEEIVDYTAHEGLSDRVLKKIGAAAGASAVKAMQSEAIKLR
jgi:protease IV